MQWTIERVTSPDYIRVNAAGPFTAGEFGSMLDSLFVFDGWEPLTPLLLDQRKVDYTEIATMELVAASGVLVSKNNHLALSKLALLLGSAKTFEIGLRFENATSHASAAFLEVFMDEASAIAWLTGPTAESVTVRPRKARLRSKAKKA